MDGHTVPVGGRTRDWIIAILIAILLSIPTLALIWLL